MTTDPCLLVQAELLTLIAGSDGCGVAEICPSQSVRELLQRDAQGSLPAIGVAYRGFDQVVDEPVGNGWFYADTLWEVSVVDRNETGRPLATQSVMEIMGRIRERLRAASSAVPPLWGYEIAHEDTEDVEDDAEAGALMVRLRIKVGA